MRILILLATLTLSACSSKYIGISIPDYQDHVCSIDEDICQIAYGQLETSYTIKNVHGSVYRITGTSQWDNTKKSKVFVKVQRMQLIFALTSEGKVVEVTSVYVRGSEGEPMKFDFEFTTLESFDGSYMLEYRGRVTE